MNFIDCLSNMFAIVIGYVKWLTWSTLIVVSSGRFIRGDVSQTVLNLKFFFGHNLLFYKK